MVMHTDCRTVPVGKISDLKIHDGGRRMAAILKTEKSLYHSSGSTYRREIWYDDTHCSY